MFLAWCCWWEFCFCRSCFPCRNYQQFSPVFHAVSCWSSSVPPGRSLSSANRKLQSGRPLMDTDDSRMSVYPASSPASHAKQSFSVEYWGVKTFSIVFSRNILNTTGVSGFPCRIPTVVRKKSQTLPFSNTALVALSYNDLMTSINRLSMLHLFF